jgi:replicative DNA helicase
MITISEQFEKKGELEKLGGAAYLATLVESTPTAANAKTYARLVKDKSLLRRLIKAGNQITLSGYEQTGDVESIIADAEKMVLDVAMGRSIEDIIPIKIAVASTFDQIQRKYEERGGISGVATGFERLDALTSGFQSSDLIIIAARPSMGKTSLALKIAENACIRNKCGVGIFSLEMSSEQLVTRMLCSVSRVDAAKLRGGFLQEDDWNHLYGGMEMLTKAPLVLVDSPGITPLELRAKARRMQKEHGIEMVIIDYMQLMTGKGRSENRVQEVSEISREMKLMARELNMPVIVLSQLSRAVEQRPNKRPMLSDLRESGAIEQDADLVMFLYREGYYKQQGDGEGEVDYEKPEAEKTELILAKHRNGPTGNVPLTFVHRYATFENYTPEPGED